MSEEKIGYAWSFVAELGSGKQFSLNGNFPKGMSKEDMNKEVDMVRSVFDRQQAKSAALAASQQLENAIHQLKAYKEDVAALDAKTETKGHITSSEKSQREAAIKNIEHMENNIQKDKKMLEQLLNEAK